MEENASWKKECLPPQGKLTMLGVFADVCLSRVSEKVNDVAFRGTPYALWEHLCQIRKSLRRSKEDMFWELLQYSDTEKREHMEWREIERQDRKENEAFVKDTTERMIKVMEEQTQMLKSLITFQTEQIHARSPLQHIQNSFQCAPPRPPPNSMHSFLLSGTSHFPVHSTLMDTFSNDSWTYAQL
ncbi:uncharacterized protein RBU57_012058 isoform 2-T4 [Macrochelys suwanniensis]